MTLLSQLELMQLAQSEQTNMMRSLEAQLSELLSVSNVGPPTANGTSSTESTSFSTLESNAHARQSHESPDGSSHLFGTQQTTIGSCGALVWTPEVNRRQLRKASWAWDPQVQRDLEDSFEMLLQSKRRIRASSSDAEMERGQEQQQSVAGDAETFSGSSMSSSILPISASRLVAKWTRLKQHRQATPVKKMQSSSVNQRRMAEQERRMGRDRTTSRTATNRQTTRAALRSSWFFRQRAAGRIHAADEMTKPWWMICRAPCLSFIPIIGPKSPFCLTFDFLVTTSVAFIAVFTPLQVAFESLFDATPWHAVSLAIEIIFVLNVALSFRRGFSHDGVHIKDPLFIAMHYFRGDFATDAIASFPCVRRESTATPCPSCQSDACLVGRSR
jgi:hypothetical protein